MNEMLTTGTWTVSAENEAVFISAWAEFAGWASTMPGAGTLRLGRDTSDPRRFVSFGDWASEAAVRGWKSTAEFRDRIARLLQHVDDFHHEELDVVASGSGGRHTAEQAVSGAAK